MEAMKDVAVQKRAMEDLGTAESTESKDDNDEKIEMFKKKISEHCAAIKLLVQEITENNDEAAQIMQFMGTVTELGNESPQDAQAAVTNTIQVLKDLYKESGMLAKGPWEFVQIRSHRDVELPDSPDTWDSSYTGVADPKSGSDGVLSILDGVVQKFGAMEADAKVQDETVQKNYEGGMQAKKISCVHRWHACRPWRPPPPLLLLLRLGARAGTTQVMKTKRADAEGNHAMKERRKKQQKATTQVMKKRKKQQTQKAAMP